MANKKKVKTKEEKPIERTKEEILKELQVKVVDLVSESPGVEFGVWITPKDIITLSHKFASDPGIKLYKLEANIRMD